jgi:hypothetical protein
MSVTAKVWLDRITKSYTEITQLYLTRDESMFGQETGASNSHHMHVAHSHLRRV